MGECKCVCVDLVWVADIIWESASVCVCGFGLDCRQRMGECKCVRVWIWSGLQITYGRVQVCVCVDLVWVADIVWESAGVCVCGFLQVCVCGFGLGC